MINSDRNCIAVDQEAAKNSMYARARYFIPKYEVGFEYTLMFRTAMTRDPLTMPQRSAMKM